MIDDSSIGSDHGRSVQQDWLQTKKASLSHKRLWGRNESQHKTQKTIGPVGRKYPKNIVEKPRGKPMTDDLFMRSDDGGLGEGDLMIKNLVI